MPAGFGAILQRRDDLDVELPRQGRQSDLRWLLPEIVVDENYVLRLPGNLPLKACAPLLCAGITLYSPLKHWGAGPARKVAIEGLGGLGHRSAGSKKTQEMLDFSAAHNIASDVEVVPMQKVNEARRNAY